MYVHSCLKEHNLSPSTNHHLVVKPLAKHFLHRFLFGIDQSVSYFSIIIIIRAVNVVASTCTIAITHSLWLNCLYYINVICWVEPGPVFTHLLTWSLTKKDFATTLHKINWINFFDSYKKTNIFSFIGFLYWVEKILLLLL